MTIVGYKFSKTSGTKIPSLLLVLAAALSPLPKSSLPRDRN